MIIVIIHIIVSYDQNISLILYVKDGSHVRLRHPSCVYITAQRQYTAVQNNFPFIITFVLTSHKNGDIIPNTHILNNSDPVRVQSPVTRTNRNCNGVNIYLSIYFIIQLQMNHEIKAKTVNRIVYLYWNKGAGVLNENV